MLPRYVSVACSFVLVAFLAPLRVEGQTTAPKAEVKKAEASKFIRVANDKDGQPRSLETAIVRYKPASGEGDLVVDLVGVVHIGEQAYYRKLNNHFEQYDVLLYELVGPKGAKPAKGGSDNPLAIVQRIMTIVLNLESQLEYIDYTKKNFVHADLSMEEMKEAITKRGDTGLTLALSIAADLLRQQNIMEQKPAKGAELPDLKSLITDPAAPSKIKRLLAQQFDNMDGALGPTLNTILVADRNQAALKVMQKEMAKGKKKIGIFYGAAHMPDFEKRLREDYGLVPVSTTWVPAWDLRLRETALEDLMFRLLREALKQ